MNGERLKQKWLEEDETQINAALGALLQHAHGRKALWWLLQVGRVGMQPYSNNALNTAFNCGELNVGQQILDRITAISPQGYVDMMKEQADERGRRTDQLAAAKSNGRDDALDNDNGGDDDRAD